MPSSPSPTERTLDHSLTAEDGTGSHRRESTESTNSPTGVNYLPMPKKPKIIEYIDGVKHWDCFMCKKILPYTDYHKTSSPTSPHASYCKNCNSERSKKFYVRKPRPSKKGYKPAEETRQQILAALQGFDPWWTMSKLQKAINDPN